MVVLVGAVLGASLACTPASNPPPDPGEGGNNGTTGGSGGSSSRGGSGGSASSSGGSGGSSSGGGSGSGSGGSSSGGASGSGGSGSGGSGSGGSSSGGASGSGGSTTGKDASASGDTGGTTPGDGGGTGGSTTPPGEFPPGPHKVVLLDSADHPEDASRKGILEVLNSMKDSHHIIVEQITDSSPQGKASALMDKALIIIGPNTRSCNGAVDSALGDIPVPVIISKDCTNFMKTGNIMNTPNTLNSIKIVNANHPLAAGLSGTVRVFTDDVCREVRAGGLGPDAIKIANTPLDTTTWAIYAYEKGGMMPAGKAPAKRVGFFWHRPSGGTAEGKKLLQAAVEWAIRP
jgi:hypothetical protein